MATVMYRNPAEEWFWESGAAFWVSAALLLAVTTVVAAYITSFLADWIGEWWRRRKQKRGQS